MNKKKLSIGLFGLTLILLMARGESAAQPPAAQAQQHNLRRNLVTLRALRMTQVLELTEEQTAVIFPELNRAEKEKAELQRQLAEEIRNLREKIGAGKSSDEEFESGVRKVRDLRHKIQAREQVFEEFLFARLTPLQKARYIIFNLDFNRVLMERAHKLGPAGQKIK